MTACQAKKWHNFLVQESRLPTSQLPRCRRKCCLKRSAPQGRSPLLQPDAAEGFAPNVLSGVCV